MPVFGKGRTHRKIPEKEKLGQELVRVLKAVITPKGLKDTYKRAYKPAENWEQKDVRLGELSKKLDFDIDSWVKQRVTRTGQPAVVLDWGCGIGSAITELARQNPKTVHAYGFSKDSYPEWEKNKFVKFIQEEPEQLLRFLKPQSVDIIFSRLGLEYHWSDLIARRNEKEFWAYLEKLSQKLKKGGLIRTTLWVREEREAKKGVELLQSHGLIAKLTLFKGPIMILTITKK